MVKGLSTILLKCIVKARQQMNEEISQLQRTSLDLDERKNNVENQVKDWKEIFKWISKSVFLQHQKLIFVHESKVETT